MQWVVRGLLGLVGLLGLLVIVLAVLLIPAHLQIRGITSALPDDAALRGLLAQPGGPVSIHVVPSSEQTRPGLSLGHTSVAIEWADGRIFLIDAAMDEAATIEFAKLTALMFGDASKTVFHGTIAERLGPAAGRIAGLGFSHLHIDHVQGIGALCEARGKGASVYRTRHQARENNLHTAESAKLVEKSCFEKVTLEGEGLLTVEGFPGIGMASLGGHTPGSTLFAAAVDGKLWLMSGDTTNSKTRLLKNQGKGFLYSGLMVPENTARTRELRLWLARLDAEPDMEVIVSHDLGAALASGLPVFEAVAEP